MMIKMMWLKKLLGLQTYDELHEDKTKQEKTIEEWRSETENMYLKIRGSKENESPYTTYFFEHCQHCNGFLPDDCFSKHGKVYADRMLICSKLKLNIKLLQEQSGSLCSCKG